MFAIRNKKLFRMFLIAMPFAPSKTLVTSSDALVPSSVLAPSTTARSPVRSVLFPFFREGSGGDQDPKNLQASDGLQPNCNPRPETSKNCCCSLTLALQLEARGGERKLAGLPVVCCWCCCCWCCCCRCCAGRCCAGCSAGAGSSAAAAAAGAGWSAAAAAAAALGMLLLLLPLGGLLLLLVLLLLPLLRWALQMLGVLQLLGGPAHRAQGGVEPRGGGGGP